MRIANKVLLATLNREKFDEFTALMNAFPQVELVRAEDLLRNPERLGYVERFNTYLENAVAKARLANHASHYPSLADDSGLEVAALQGKPGVRSHRICPPQTRISQDQANFELLLKELQSAGDRSAKFVCTLVLVIEGFSSIRLEFWKGPSLIAPRGNHGFGYDPVFIPKGASKTLAEMTEAEKNAISHRAKALQDLMTQVKAHGIVFAKP